MFISNATYCSLPVFTSFVDDITNILRTGKQNMWFWYVWMSIPSIMVYQITRVFGNNRQMLRSVLNHNSKEKYNQKYLNFDQ